MTDSTLTVSEVLAAAREALIARFPAPIWVRGEVSGYRRTSGGAAFFRLADDEGEDSLDVAARGRVMADVDRTLGDAGLGHLRDGVVVRLEGTIGMDSRRSIVRLTMHSIDPEFTAGRLALDRAALLKKLAAEGALERNGRREVPLVPLQIGLVTSRGSAAHADFLDQLRRSGFRFRVKTVHTNVQGEGAAEGIADALRRISRTEPDVVVLARGGGARLDLSAFDNEAVARAIADMPVPVIAGIGHEIDTSVADEVAAVSVKTPSAAGEWLVGRVTDFSNRLQTARHMIRDAGRDALARHRRLLAHAASDIAAARSTLKRQHDAVDRMQADIAASARAAIERQVSTVEALSEWFRAVDIAPTLNRGFAMVTDQHGERIVTSADQAAPGDRLVIRFKDGTVPVQVEEQ